MSIVIMIDYHRRMINNIVLQLFSSLIHHFLSCIFEVDWFIDIDFHQYDTPRLKILCRIYRFFWPKTGPVHVDLSQLHQQSTWSASYSMIYTEVKVD